MKTTEFILTEAIDIIEIDDWGPSERDQVKKMVFGKKSKTIQGVDKAKKEQLSRIILFPYVKSSIVTDFMNNVVTDAEFDHKKHRKKYRAKFKVVSSIYPIKLPFVVQRVTL
mmetsp:Transcript_4507/g.6793  ORF Transcript_4507/g.6793 Transcript_4507/m.6793 type:complete len:112 (-) Transcript_4507:540-875(-)